VTLDSSLTAGLAGLETEETLEQLIARADAAMYAERGKHGV
jgi:PleD family two-component response regulator